MATSRSHLSAGSMLAFILPASRSEGEPVVDVETQPAILALRDRGVSDRVDRDEPDEEAAADGGVPLLGGFALEPDAPRAHVAEEADARGKHEPETAQLEANLAVAEERFVSREAVPAVAEDAVLAA